MGPGDTITIDRVACDEATLALLARLRMRVFHEWPYLYDGCLEYEREYLAEFIKEDEAVLIVAREGGQPIGMATASPLQSQSAAVKEPVLKAGFAEDETFYFGESVLLPAYRGKGLGHAFFNERESAARDAGARTCVFCAVERPAGHALRPPSVRDLAVFWRGRGYERLNGVTMHLRWKDRDVPAETDHLMQFWAKTFGD